MCTSTPAAENPASSAASSMYPEMRVSLPMQTAECWRWPLTSPARTLPAAYPSRRTKSGVIGLAPTVPRTPSVPKYLRVILECLPHGDHVPGFLHIMHAQYCRAALQRKQSHRETSGKALLNRSPGELAQSGLSGEPCHQRHVQVHEFAQSAKQLQMVRGGLAEADARIPHHAVAADACESRLPHPILEEGLHLRDDVVVARLALHRRRRALHLH